MAVIDAAAAKYDRKAEKIMPDNWEAGVDTAIAEDLYKKGLDAIAPAGKRTKTLRVENWKREVDPDIKKSVYAAKVRGKGREKWKPKYIAAMFE